MKVFRSVLWSASALFVLGAPFFLDRGALNDLWSLAFAVTLASAWNLLGGFAGQISLGYSAFLGIGAYTTVLLSLRGVDPFLTLPLGAILAALFSVAIGLPAFRLRGPYFTIATIGVSEAVRVCAASVSFTGGSSGPRRWGSTQPGSSWSRMRFRLPSSRLLEVSTPSTSSTSLQAQFSTSN